MSPKFKHTRSTNLYTTKLWGKNTQVTSAQKKKKKGLVLFSSIIYVYFAYYQILDTFLHLKYFHHTHYSADSHLPSLLATQTCITPPLSLSHPCSEHYPVLIYKWAKNKPKENWQNGLYPDQEASTSGALPSLLLSEYATLNTSYALRPIYSLTCNHIKLP